VTARLSLRERQIFVTLRVTQYVMTGKIYTLVSECQAHTIQIASARVRSYYGRSPAMPTAWHRSATGINYITDKQWSTYNLEVVGTVQIFHPRLFLCPHYGNGHSKLSILKKKTTSYWNLQNIKYDIFVAKMLWAYTCRRFMQGELAGCSSSLPKG